MATRLNKLIYILLFYVSISFIGVSFLISVDVLGNASYLKKDYYFKSNSFHQELWYYYTYLRNYINESYGKEGIEGNYTIEDAKANIDHYGELRYYIKDLDTDEIFTNIEDKAFINTEGKVELDKYIKKNVVYDIEYPSVHQGGEYTRLGDYEFNIWFNQNNFEGRIMFVNAKDGKSQISKDYDYFISIKERLLKEVRIAMTFIIVALVIMIYLIKNKNMLEHIRRLRNMYRNIVVEIRIAVFVYLLMFLKVYIETREVFSLPINQRQVIAVIISSIGVLMVYLFVYDIIEYRNNPDMREVIRSKSIIYSIWNNIREVLIGTSVRNKVILLNLFNLISGASIVLLIVNVSSIYSPYIVRDKSGAEILVLVIILLCLKFTFDYSSRNAKMLDNIIKGTKDMAEGNLNSIVAEKEECDEGIRELANNINSMREAFKHSIDKQVQSERLKTELITNVSHDLKTPLTAIINYVKLLNQEDIKEEELKHYADVLNNKTNRLKVLVDDLFEMAKLSSGEVELNIEEVDICAILRQALGEFYQELEDSKVKFKVNIPAERVVLSLDGMRTWRVFENLIGNIFKYSQENTRAYIDLEEGEDEVRVIMKNIASYEMDFDPNEIYERFKRGDKARTTEGSGLGLAIAKNIIELQGGTMQIVVDGDLFKAIIKFSRSSNYI